MGSLKNEKSYQIGSSIGTVLANIIFVVFKILFYGLFIAPRKNIKILFFYIGIIVLSIPMNFLGEDIESLFIILLIAIVFMGAFEYLQEVPDKNKIKFYNDLFEKINFHSIDGNFPYFLYEKDISNFVCVLAFNTLIPLKEWKSKKETIEMYFNEKIIDIKQDKENNNIIEVVIQTQSLLSNINWDNSFINKTKNILNIGIGYYDNFVGMNLDKTPHAFVAGESGSGKTNLLKCMIHQSLVKDYEVVLIDFKRGVSFADFSNIVKIYCDYETTIQVLTDLVQETNKRLDLLKRYKADNLKDYNKISDSQLKRKIVFIDELAELLKIRDKEISNSLYDSLETLTRLSRAVGIHLIMGIQRPDSTVINGQIKSNVSFRVCGRFVDREPSRIMLSNDMASSLPNIKGRFIVKDGEMQEIQCFYFSNAKIDDLSEKREETINYMDSVEKSFPKPNNEPENEIKRQDDIKESSELDFDFSDIKKKKP